MSDIFSFIIEYIASWRFFTCTLVAVSIAMYLKESIPQNILVNISSIIIVIVGIVGGFIWEFKAAQNSKL